MRGILGTFGLFILQRMAFGKSKSNGKKSKSKKPSEVKTGASIAASASSSVGATATAWDYKQTNHKMKKLMKPVNWIIIRVGADSYSVSFTVNPEPTQIYIEQ